MGGTMKYELGQEVKLIKSEERGTVSGRAEYLTGEPCYWIIYKAADGRQVECWWNESAIEAVA